MKTIRIRKAVAILLLFTMLLSVMPLSVFAEEPDPAEHVVTEEIVIALAIVVLSGSRLS